MTKIEIDHQGFELTKDVKRYVNKKIGKLDRFVKPTKRRQVRADVRLKEEQGKKKNKVTAEVTLHSPNGRMTAEESTVNIFAAIDIVEAKLANQMRKQKDKKTSHRNKSKRISRRLQKLMDRDFRGKQN